MRTSDMGTEPDCEHLVQGCGNVCQRRKTGFAISPYTWLCGLLTMSWDNSKVGLRYLIIHQLLCSVVFLQHRHQLHDV
jgi:hypothetical protein